jgi:hypothetical protein
MYVHDQVLATCPAASKGEARLAASLRVLSLLSTDKDLIPCDCIEQRALKKKL